MLNQFRDAEYGTKLGYCHTDSWLLATLNR